MGQGASAFLGHPLTGLALNIGYTWLTSMSNNDTRDYNERAILHTFADAGIDVAQMNSVMPNQEEYIRRMQNMEGQLNAERVLTRQAQESLRRTQQKLKEQMKRNAEMQNYLSTKPARAVKMDKHVKLSSTEAAQKNGVDNVNYVNFAFVGHTKNGKSSLINAIRGLTKDDPDAAGVDVLECTQTIKWYTVPNGKMPNVRFYDVPGSGAMSHRAADYYQEKALCGFDCLVILVQQTLGEEEIKFALAALEYNQKVVFVRSKCDIDFHLKDESGKTLRSLPTAEEIQEHINELRYAFNAELEKHAPELSAIKCFFISAKSMRAIIRGEPSDMIFEETEFLDYLYKQSKKARGISTF